MGTQVSYIKKSVSSQRQERLSFLPLLFLSANLVMVNKRIVFNPRSEGPRYECVDDQGTGDELKCHQVCVQVSTCVLRTPNNKITRLLQNKKDADKVKLYCSIKRPQSSRKYPEIFNDFPKFCTLSIP